MTLRPRIWERILAFTTAAFVITLAWAIEASIGSNGGTLNFPHLWPILLMAGGGMAFAQGFRHTELTWSLTTALLVTTLLGRGWDILLNADEFPPRVWIALAFHTGSAALIGVSWIAVGGVVDALRRD